MAPLKNGRDAEALQAATAQWVTAQLRQEILEGRLLPGERLGQEMLAEKFQSSRMPVRAALRQLESEGLVAIVPNSGSWVAKPDRFEFEQAYKMREAIEPLAIQESLPYLSAEDLKRLEQLVEDIDSAIEGTLQVEQFLRLDREFHLLTYTGVQHRPLIALVERLWNTTQHYRRALIGQMKPHALKATSHDHALIMDGIRRRDEQAAASMVRLHIHRTRQTLDTALGIFE
ncbi:GntR family transcriptional regulator [Micrococcus terreus]|uniref:GntR family transcriptional regulator n=1 Tax=Micrococcus terreus TaxID=574650 RepID=UPI00254D7005|nr:GntR family transcriptional regulator [Micrococcus terreus]MDK7701097.1 GntR family transcriptional regulator [Micrococcus terreus]WOO96855.1 GntR family transcriptional regulator [Micrococcus terreus]